MKTTFSMLCQEEYKLGISLVVPCLIIALLVCSTLGCSLVSSIFSPDRQDNDAAPVNPQDEQVPADPGQAAGDELVQGAEPEQGVINGSLPGIWVSDTDTGYGTTMHTELVLEYTGTFSQTVTAGSLMTWDVGTYAVGNGFIRFVVENHEPKEYLGQTMSWATGFTYYYTFIDEDTLLLEDRLIDTSWYAYRQ